MTIHMPAYRQLRRRTDEILCVASELLCELGYHDFNIGRLAEAMGVSRGTIYQYFASKEELAVTLAVQCLELRIEMLDRANAFNGNTRERMTAIGEAMEIAARLYPNEMLIVELVRTQAAHEKTSKECRARLAKAHKRAIQVMLDIISDGLKTGELVLPTGVTSQALSFGLWTMTIGGYATLMGVLSLPDIGVTDVFDAVRVNWHMIADGYGWRPFTREHDYAAVAKRVREEVFSEEWKQLAAH